MVRNFLQILDLKHSEAHELVRRAKEMKDSGYVSRQLDGKILVLLFEKASTRTRISFEAAIRQLGGSAVFMTPAESQLGRSEPLKDTARVLSRYAQGLVVRTYGQRNLEELAHYGSIPVINALTDQFHPCQVMSDMLTVYERTPKLDTLTIAWVGDGNNMAHSWINAASYFGFELRVAVPRGYEPDTEVLAHALSLGARVYVTHDPKEAVEGAHYVNTDVWASMGQEEEQEKRETVFQPFQVNNDLLRLARPDVKALHCLPAHRGEEITDEVMEGVHSIVWDQAENRLHMQKALLEWVYKE
ncbi:MAG: ornithine carbamoyltransferase [bacterium]